MSNDNIRDKILLTYDDCAELLSISRRAFINLLDREHRLAVLENRQNPLPRISIVTRRVGIYREDLEQYVREKAKLARNKYMSRSNG